MILHADGLSFAYPGLKPNFTDLAIGAAAGEIVCILGPNGVGKSTLLRCLAGLAPPTTGEIRLLGDPIASLERGEIAKRVALVPQSHEAVFAFPVHVIVEMGRAPYLNWFSPPSAGDIAIAWRALDTLGIVHLAEKPYTEISGGERQLVLLARVLAQQPKLLILDEPTAHLDFANQARFLGLVRRLAADGLAIIFTTHAPDQAFAVADRTLLMSRTGPSIIGDTGDILSEGALHDTYQVPVKIVRSGNHISCVVEV